MKKVKVEYAVVGELPLLSECELDENGVPCVNFDIDFCEDEIEVDETRDIDEQIKEYKDDIRKKYNK